MVLHGKQLESREVVSSYSGGRSLWVPVPFSCPYSREYLEVDFSQLRADGVGMLLTHPLKDRPALDAPIACSVILANKKVAAL